MLVMTPPNQVQKAIVVTTAAVSVMVPATLPRRAPPVTPI
jgi:hypothetical protein